jgi:integrase
MKTTFKERIDRMIPGYGRFQKRTGARTAAEDQARRALFQRLLEADQLDVIRMLDHDEITWAELRQAERKKRLGSDNLGADVALGRRLWDEGEEDDALLGAFSSTLPQMGKADSTRTRYAVVFDQLKAHAAAFLPADATVKDLRAVKWTTVFASMDELSPASRNRVRSALSAFLTVFLNDKRHPFRGEILRAMGGMEKETPMPHEVSVDEFWTLVDAVDDAIKPSLLTLAATGMRVGEYLQCTDASLKRLPTLLIPNGKGGTRETSVAPTMTAYVRQAIPCRISPAPAAWVAGGTYPGVQRDARYKRLYKAVVEASTATGIPATVHTLRHLYAQLGVDNESSARVAQAMGHTRSAMTDRYAKRRVMLEVATAVAKDLGRKRKRA